MNGGYRAVRTAMVDLLCAVNAIQKQQGRDALLSKVEARLLGRVMTDADVPGLLPHIIGGLRQLVLDASTWLRREQRDDPPDG